MKITSRLALLLCLSASWLTAFALPSEDLAVVRRCGSPLSQDKQQSPATNEFNLNLFYPDDVVIHFISANGGWQISSAWMKHIPVTRNGLAERMPCVKEAIDEVAREPRPEVDPTIASQTIQGEARRGFGIPFLWLIFFLIITLLVAIIIPTPRKRTPDLPIPRAPRREPEVVVQERIRQSSAQHKVAE